MTRLSHYQAAHAKLRASLAAPVVVPLTRDECAALLDALRDLSDAAGRPPRRMVETDPPGCIPVEAMAGDCPACDGSGLFPTDGGGLEPCINCDHTGRVEVE